MKLLAMFVISATLVAATWAVAQDVRPPENAIIQDAVPMQELGPRAVPHEQQHSDKVRQFAARKQAVETLQNELESGDFTAALRKEEDRLSRTDNPERLIVFGVALAQDHAKELDKFLTQLITARETNIDVRVEAAKIAAFCSLPAATQAAQAVVMGNADPASYGLPPVADPADAKKAQPMRDRMRFYFLRALLRSSPADKLDFIRKIADGGVANADYLVKYAEESLAALKQAGRIKRDTPVALSNSLANAVQDSDTKTIVALNGEPILKPQSVSKVSLDTRSRQLQVMQKFLTQFAPIEANWTVLYDTAGCWNNEFELILRRECGLWYVEFGGVTPWSQ